MTTTSWVLLGFCLAQTVLVELMHRQFRKMSAVANRALKGWKDSEERVKEMYRLEQRAEAVAGDLLDELRSRG